MLRTVRVRLVDVPVALCCAADQHTQDLLREIALIAASRPELGRTDVFAQLLATADRYAHRPADVRRRIAESVALAQRQGWDRVTVDLDADTEAAGAALAWEELLRRFDDMSRDEQLLTLPAGPDVEAYRSWYVAELVEQVRTGRAPVAWDSAGARALAGTAS